MNALGLLCLLGVGYFGSPYCCFGTVAKAEASGESLYCPFDGPLSEGPIGGPLRRDDDFFYWYLPPLPERETSLTVRERGEQSHAYSVGCGYSFGRRRPLLAPPLPPPSRALIKIKSFGTTDLGPTGVFIGPGWVGCQESVGAPLPFSIEDVLFQDLSHPDERVRLASVVALSHERTDYVAEALITTLSEDPSPSVREAAVQALAALRAVGAFMPLKRAADNDADAGVRRSARFALQVLLPELQANPLSWPARGPQGFCFGIGFFN